ncbi:MAG: hypothetical protein ACRDJS_02910 [Actinomycetota bacterium]
MAHDFKPEFSSMNVGELRDEFNRLTERRRAILKQAAGIHDRAKGEGRELTEGENNKIADLGRGSEKLGEDLTAIEYEIADKESRQEHILRLARNPKNIERGDGSDGPELRTYASARAACGRSSGPTTEATFLTPPPSAPRPSSEMAPARTAVSPRAGSTSRPRRPTVEPSRN